VQAEISLTIPIGDVLPDSSDPITATEISLESDDKPNSQFSSFELTLPLLGAASTLTVQIPLNAKLMDDKLMNSLYALKAFILATMATEMWTRLRIFYWFTASSSCPIHQHGCVISKTTEILLFPHCSIQCSGYAAQLSETSSSVSHGHHSYGL